MREENPELWEPEKPFEISLRELAAPLFRRRWVLIATFLTVLALAVLDGILTPLEYTSHTAILVNRERLDPLVTTEATTQLVNESDPVTEEEMNSEAELLKSRDVLEKVVLVNGLEKQVGSSFLNLFRPKQDEADKIARAVRSLANKIKIGSVEKTNLINIEYSSPDPQLAYGVLRALDECYLAKRLTVYRPSGSLQFFTQETQSYRKALGNSENDLKIFGQQPGAAAPDLERTDLAAQVTNSIGQLHSSEEAIASDEQRIRSDQQQMQIIPKRSPTLQSTSQADKLLGDLQSALLAARIKRAQVAVKYSSDYPLVQEADQEIAAAQAAVAEAEATRYVTRSTDRDPTFELLREDETKTAADLAAQRANRAAVAESIESLQRKMTDLDQKALIQQDLERDVKANEANYLLYLTKQEQARTSEALDKTRIANVAIAIPPEVPALPDHSFLFFLFVGLILAVVLAIAMAYLADYFDSSFHTPAQLRDVLDIPIVIAVPKATA